MHVHFTKLRDDAFLPIRTTNGSACYDLCTVEPFDLNGAKQRQLVSTGISVTLPAGHVGLICSRSGLAAKRGIFVLNAPGIVDEDYTGELKVVLARHELNAEWSNPEPDCFSPGDRIAQLLVLALPALGAFGAINFNKVRAGSGFGSTGIQK